jgi:hypothetical protein
MKNNNNNRNQKSKSLNLNKKAVSALNEEAVNGGRAASISFPMQACSFPLDACNIERR